MVTLKQLAAQHIDRLSQGDRRTESELSFQDVIFKIRQVLNELLRVVYYPKMQDGDRSAVTQCIASYELTLETGGDYAFVTLPEFYLDLPNNYGIHRIFQRALKKKGFPTDREFSLAHQPSTNFQSRTARYPGLRLAWVEQNKVKLYNVHAEPGDTDKLIVQIIVAAPDTIGENDFLPITPDMQTKVLDRLLEIDGLKPVAK